MTHASVFSGIGGPEVAAAMLGWENLFHCEINPFGRTVLQYWFPKSKSYEDITKTDFSEWGGKVNVLTGGFPCQPFSYAGQRRGADDDRYLWPYMHRCINQVRPDWVVCENVAGILTMVEQGDVTEMEAEKSLFGEENPLHRYRLDETFTLERICNDLESDGYAVQAVVIPACAVNAPHRRDRVFIIGHRIVADTDNGANGRTARKNEAKGRDQRLQERHEVRQPDQPTQVRPTAEGYVPDSIRKGLEGKDQPRCGKGGERLHLRRDSARCNRQDDQERATATDTDCRGEGTPRKGDGTESDRCDQDKLTGQRGTTTQRDCGLHAVLRSTPHTEGNGSDRIATGESGQAARQDGQLDAEPAINGGVLSKPSADTTSKDGNRGSAQVRQERETTTNNEEHTIFPSTERFGGERATPNPNSNGQCSCGRPSGRAREKMDSRGAGKPFNGIERLGASRPATDTTQQRGQRYGFEQPGTGRAQQIQFRGGGCKDGGIAGLGRWDTFPTVSPVHRGNDGIPFPLDNLTISPSKWRTESLKAYGNAIVPQVMYEIFKAIEETEKQHRS